MEEKYFIFWDDDYKIPCENEAYFNNIKNAFRFFRVLEKSKEVTFAILYKNEPSLLSNVTKIISFSKNI